MHERVKRLKAVFYLPVFLGVIRVVFTLVIAFVNPFGMPFRMVQIIPAAIIIGSLFMYLKLFSDNVPVVSLLVPSVAQFLIIFAFSREVVVLPFLPVLFLDLLFIVGKIFKASAFPFEFEGDSFETELADLEELIVNEKGS